MTNSNGFEHRRYKRLKAEITLNISSLFKQDNVSIKNIDSPIEVVDISKSGFGFETESILPMDFYFNAEIKLGHEKDIYHSVVKIVRCQPIPGSDKFSYGCEFVGKPKIIDYIFDEYEAELNTEEGL